ncbi:MAG: endolytic transglycosylase MltG, partial [Treponema sp.]|nr:endolytic transglycosylase MltG [Treponema sp.]
TYRIELPASQIQIRSVLTVGQQMMVRVTIPEGSTLRQTALIIEEAGVAPAGDFLAAASSAELLSSFNIPGQTIEGYLFPDTYLFPLSYPAPRVVAAFAENFFRRLAQIAPESAGMTAQELHNRVIMASIVEREYRIKEEAALMAGVFFHRLDIGMLLQSCATVVYVMTEVQGRPHPERLFFRDLEIQSPFNTYMHSGLPPAPISSPGEVALSAAFNPQQTDYLFFRLVDVSAGRHFFSRTIEDHNTAGIPVKGR